MDFDNIKKEKLLNDVYSHISHSPKPSYSLISFLKTPPIAQWLIDRIEQGPWAELGCGMRSFFESWEEVFDTEKKRDLFGLDLSSKAIERARAYGDIHYEQADLSENIPHGPYAVILDGHFLHCLNSVPEVYQTLGKIREALLPGGLYIGEVMMSHKSISFGAEFEYDVNNNLLYKDGIPSRVIMDAFEWEDMFAASGLRIQYFVCQSSIKIIPEDSRDTPMTGDPECLRFCLERVD